MIKIGVICALALVSSVAMADEIVPISPDSGATNVGNPCADMSNTYAWLSENQTMPPRGNSGSMTASSNNEGGAFKVCQIEDRSSPGRTSPMMIDGRHEEMVN